jgi:hypothetical protein
MSVVYLLLGGRDAIVNGIITPEGFYVFSIYNFLEIVLISGTEPRKSRDEVRNAWKKLCRHNTQFKEVKGILDLAVPSTKMRRTKPTAGTTVVGLKGVLDVLGNTVAADCRKVLEDIFARYGAGDRSMIVVVNLNDKEHPQIPRFSYNFQPPTASSQEPMDSIIIEDAEAGAAEPEPSSRESSRSMEFDFTSTEDHVI